MNRSHGRYASGKLTPIQKESVHMLTLIIKLIIKPIFHLIINLPAFVYLGIDALAKLMSKPFLIAYYGTKRQLRQTNIGLFITDWNKKLAWFGGALPFCLFVLCGIYSGVWLYIVSGKENGLVDFLETVLFNTPVGSFIGFFVNGLNFTPATVLSIAFSATLCLACLGEEPNNAASQIASYVLRGIVFLVATALLAEQLAKLFQIIGDWAYHALLSLLNAEPQNFFAVLGKVLGLLLLGYPALYMLLLALKEYFEAIAYGVIFLLIGIMLTAFSQYVIRCSSEVTNIINLVYVILGIFGVVLLRPWADKILEKCMPKKAAIFQKKIIDWWNSFTKTLY